MDASAERTSELVLGLIPDSLPLDFTKLTTIFDLEVSLFASHLIEARIERLSSVACRKCIGIVVDPTSGEAYCGRDAPSEVLASVGRAD